MESKNNGTCSNKSIQVIKTPAEFMAVLNNRWNIDWDLACTEENAQYTNHITETYLTESHREQDTHRRVNLRDNTIKGSFGVNWYKLSDNYLFLNPPFCKAEPACKPDCMKDRCKKRGVHNIIPQMGITKWMEKCKYESQRGAKIITLTLASLGASWYKDWVEGNANVWVLRGRLKFEGHKDPYPKDLMLCEWVSGMNSFGYLDWKKQIPANYRVEKIETETRNLKLI